MLDGLRHPFLPQNGCENKVFMSEIGFPASPVAKQRRSTASDGGSHGYKTISHHRSISVVHHQCAMESLPHGMTLDTPPTPPSPVALTVASLIGKGICSAAGGLGLHCCSDVRDTALHDRFGFCHRLWVYSHAVLAEGMYVWVTGPMYVNCRRFEIGAIYTAMPCD